MRYKKKPVVIEAIQWNGENANEIKEWCNKDKNNFNFVCGQTNPNQIEINTLEGVMLASIGDYIIKGIKGEFYPCKPDIFEETYEVLDE